MTIRLIYLVLLLFFTSIQAQPEITKLTGGHNTWPPYINENGHGLINDLVSAAFRAQGIEFEFKTAPFSRIVKMAENNQIDLVAALWTTEQRRASMLFSTPYFHNELVLISNNTTPIDYQGIESLRFRSVATVRGYSYHALLDGIDELTITDVLSLHTCLELVNKGRVELAIADYLAFEYERSKHPEFNQLKAYFPAIIRWPLHIGVSKANPNAEQIIKRFNLGLSKIQQNGEYNQILSAYIEENRFIEAVKSY
ncbi:substrate-binding periplasmic protein [Pseudoalteromonas sp. S16_S37]|uniref:substrate-binding periplasmic protein n=1 Tax=Pseudoalteromonas sp. S16_S37 TaxID=2720228 RepID=UPI0016813562|nr:transporter substrate-binding domain-containing protein [Pseudoalteromonas sp. S16_S37]MBD1583114.1 amino acid ABC transporter substrate-binding protein [Pseudoalteromonas sp. S16_S37]